MSAPAATRRKLSYWRDAEMSERQIFVGRKKEIERFKKVLADPLGQAVLVVGQAGMGKTCLLNKMAEITIHQPSLKCGYIRYEVTPTDAVESIMTLMMDNAFEAAKVKEKSLDGTDRRLEQWRSFLNVFNIGDLVMSLRRDPARNTREQFLERLDLISKRLPNNGRAIFIIDPEKYMQKESDQAWAIVTKNLPDKIKLIFAQRPEDELVRSETFGSLKNVVHIPEKDLDVLSSKDVDDLVMAYSTELSCSIGDLKKVLMQYKGHPYAVGAAIGLVKEGVGLEDLPKRPEPIKFAEKQWEKICEKAEAIKLFEAYAILEVGVPDDVVAFVSSQKSTTRKHLQNDRYLGGLLRVEGYGKRIYHAILADYILNQISQAERKEYHARVVKVYRGKLSEAEKKKVKPDELAAIRLAEHVFAAEGKKAFVYSFINECYKPLVSLGFLDAAISLTHRALVLLENNLEEQAVLLGNLGLIYRKRGDLDKAEQMFRKGLQIDEKIGRLEGIASDYGNLGLIYSTRGDLDKAEQMHLKSLEIEKKLGRLEGMASEYGSLGAVYEERGDLKKARQYWEKALEIFKKIGMKPEVEKVRGWIEGLNKGGD